MRNKIRYKVIFSGVLFTLLLHSTVWAQEGNGNPAENSGTNNWLFYGIATFFFFLLFFMIAVLSQLKKLSADESAKEKISFRQWWARIDNKLFTKAVPVENEEDILLDHDYDGIKELDNALPPWWKYGFYISLVIAVLYLLRFHVFKTGPTPEEEYNQEMKIAAAQLEDYRKKSNDMVDETTVVMADAAGIEAGRQIFQTTCFPCHGSKGEGGVGPNLTDEYWLHGGSIHDVFKSIKYGWPDKGMQSWQKTFSPSQIKNLASYVKSLKGTNPPNAKAPQGDLFTETVATDSSAVSKNSISKK